MQKRQHARWAWLAAFASLAIVLTGAIAAGASADKSAQGACATIAKYQLQKQTNSHAASVLAACGRTPASQSQLNSNFSSLAHLSRTPNDYGGADVNLITGGEGTFPHVTQSETQVWAQGNTVVTAYNDSRTAPTCYQGGSYSTNGGTTWTDLNARPFCTGHGTGFGDPVVVYDVLHSKWIAVFLASGCGGQGLGVWTSTDGITWPAGPCAHSGTSDDRESGWVDNNPSSPFYGRAYISFNNFSVGGGALQVIWSNDGGSTWTAPVTVVGSFIRDVQVTVGPDGKVFIATMNEGGGGLNPRTNIMEMSANGGASWSSVNMGASFPAPGVALCSSNSYFVNMYPQYWRHMGWGDVAVGPSNVVHYAYAQHGAGADKGDIYYVRSTDNGLTWSPPLRLDADGGTRGQWQPSVAVTPAGHVFVSWYDQRNTSGDDLQRFGRLSTDNGASWQPAAPVSDVTYAVPTQPDPNIQPCYTTAAC
ncbi:MAG: exo-alpha-sialidase [Actinobacteria bacterium]|nr:MAG: exo-alpha-sialidase [Actinomycetota bacterium]